MRVTGLSLVLAITYLVLPLALLAVAARRPAWFAHWAAGGIVGLGAWFALGALSPSLVLAGAVGAAVALPVRYPGNRIVRVGALLTPGVFTWLVVGSGSFDGSALATVGIVTAAPLYLVLVDLLTWDAPRLVMRQLGVTGPPDAMDRIESRRVGKQVEWQSWSVLGLLAGVALVGLWWGGGRAPYNPSYSMVPFQVDPTDTWLDVNGAYNVDWQRTQNSPGDAHTIRVFDAGNRMARMSVTNTGNPLLAQMYYNAAYGASLSVEAVSLNALGTPTVVRADLLTAERLDCTGVNENGACTELVYTAYVDQYLVEVAMRSVKQVKVGQLAPLVDQGLEQLQRRLSP